MSLAVLGLSFGFRKKGEPPCVSNVDLARLIDTLPVEVVVVQHEIAAEMLRLPDHIVREHSVAGQYLDSDEVIRQGLCWLQQHRPLITEIAVVAHPFIHLPLVLMLVWHRWRKMYQIRLVRIGRIRYDTQSEQWWTRGPVRSLWYTVRRVLCGLKGR